MNRSLLIISMALLLSSCADRYARKPHKSLNYFSDTKPASGENKDLQSLEQETKIVIYNASIDLIVEESNIGKIKTTLDSLALKYGGYVLIAGNYKTTLRIKAASLQEAISDISTHGKIKNIIISGEDVTNAYYDFEMRLENAEKARQRYLELLAKAENVEAALKVEKELERLNGEIDAIKGQLKRLQHLAAYSTITINIEKKTKVGALGYVALGTYKAVKWLFVRS